MLEIKNLHVSVEDKEVLKGLNLTIGNGEVHAIMGPNGSGKSTLSRALAGHPSYTVTSGSADLEIDFKKTPILTMTPEERSRAGIYMAFQYPIEVPGVSNYQFFKESFDAHCEAQGAPKMDDKSFRELVLKKAKIVDLGESFLERGINEGFSGGEKKRNEILQMLVLSPRLCILDETDSGLDIDSLKTVSAGVNSMRNSDRSFLLITHYQRLLDYIKPDFVHVFVDGKIKHSGGPELAKELEKFGYEKYMSGASSKSGVALQ
jgi:Fe-S cluster assembly ATP-binding protein